MGRSMEHAIRHNPMLKAQLERQLGGTIIADGRNDGRLTVYRSPMQQVGGLMRQAIGAGMLPGLGIAGALAGLAMPMGGALAANAVARGLLSHASNLSANIAGFMSGNNVDSSRAKLMADPESHTQANAMGINLANATFEDILFLLLMKYAGKKEKEIMNKVNELDQSSQKGANEAKQGKGGVLGGLLGPLGGIVGNMIAPGLGGAIGGALGSAAGGAMSSAGQTQNQGGQVFDQNGNVGDPSQMSETGKQQALQKLMGDLTKLYEMLSNMIKSMHDMQMTPTRNLRG
jgi:hypothetical protein